MFLYAYTVPIHLFVAVAMLHESEEDGVEGILSLYDTPFGLSTYIPSSRCCII